MPAAIDAETDDACHAAARQRRAFQQECPTSFAPLNRMSFGHLRPSARIAAPRMPRTALNSATTGDETELGQMLRRCRIDQQKRRIKIAGRRRPRPAPAAPPSVCSRATSHSATGIAFARETHRLFVRRADAVANNRDDSAAAFADAPSSRRLRKATCAAERRSLDNGRRINPEDQHEDGWIARAPPAPPARAIERRRRGSSKYMILTMRR